jgi:hypothetical protein
MASKHRQLKALERQLEEVSARLERISTPPPADPAQPPPPQGFFRTEAEFQSAVNAAAEQRATIKSEQNKFVEDSTKAYEKGVEVYSKEKFDAAVAKIPSVFGDIAEPATMQAILATDNPAKVLYELGSNLENAARIYNLPPHRRLTEFIKMALPNAPEVRRTSNATPPIEPISSGTGGSISTDLADNLTDDEWYRRRSIQKRQRWLASRGKAA